MDNIKRIWYLAGKIAAHDWRHQIAVNLRNASPKDDELLPIHHMIYNEPTPAHVSMFGGPYFISCDHRCYHGPGTHGADETGCEGGNCDGMERGEVVSKCLSWIDRATDVFAWINTYDCYGTLFELGYALARGKRISLYMPTNFYLDDISDRSGMDPTRVVSGDGTSFTGAPHDMWFIIKACAGVRFATDPVEAFMHAMNGIYP